MTDLQFNILDELYFLTSFADLAAATGLAPALLQQELQDLLRADWVRSYFPDPDTLHPFQAEHFREQGQQYFYLATKEGLLAHNSR